MWFNILKIEGRRAAYRLFVNSMVHLGELIPPKPPTEVLNEGGIRLLAAETSNGHFVWEQELNSDGTMGKFYLASAPNDIEPYIDYIEGMFEQEYPEYYAALQDFFKENAPPTEESEVSVTPPTNKKIIRKIMEDWGGYMDNINSFIISNLVNIGISIPLHHYERRLQADINTHLYYKQVRDKIYSGRFDTGDLPLVTIHAIQEIYADNLRNRNPDIVWENFINFTVYFRQEYIQLISTAANNQNYDNFYQERENAVLDVTYEQVRNIARNMWRTKADDVETLMRQLPNYN